MAAPTAEDIAAAKNQGSFTAVLTTNKGEITLNLDGAAAPLHVANFVKLARAGFYNGVVFHRVVPNFVIQTGDPTGTGMGGPGHSIKGEFRSNGVNNPLKHTRGTLSMARSARPDSAGSKFFIMHADSPHLDGQYAAFGRVTEGMDAVDEIAETETDRADRPKMPQRIKKAYIES